MPTTTTELALPVALDPDDTADYLTISLANGLRTLDALFNNVTGHNHGSAHQGGPITTIPASAIPDGSITAAKIADGTITGLDIADRSIPGIKFTQPLNDDILMGSGKTVFFISNRGLGYTATGDAYVFYNAAAKLLVGWDTVNSPIAQTQINGNGSTAWGGYASAGANNPGTLSTPGSVLFLNDVIGGAGDGGVLLFGAQSMWFAGLKGFFANGANNGIGDLSFATRRNPTDTVLTEAMRIAAAGGITMAGTLNVAGATRIASGGGGVSLSSATAPPATGLLLGGLPGFAAGDHYLVIDASGNVHRSALGPAS